MVSNSVLTLNSVVLMHIVHYQSLWGSCQLAALLQLPNHPSALSLEQSLKRTTCIAVPSKNIMSMSQKQRMGWHLEQMLVYPIIMRSDSMAHIK